MKRIVILVMMFSNLGVTVTAADVRLSVAASLTEATRELIDVYGQQHPGTKVLPNFAASGALAKQIAQGAPADLFISANPKWMNYLVEEQLVSAAEVTPFVGNALVLVGQKGQPVTTLEEALKLSRIAIASPRSAPAGKYVEQALHSAGLTERFAAKLVMSKDVRQALMYADTGEVEGAFIYRTDALLASNAVILFEVPQTLYPLVSYPLALTRQGETNPEALAFADFLKGAKAATILRRYGFSLP